MADDNKYDATWGTPVKVRGDNADKLDACAKLADNLCQRVDAMEEKADSERPPTKEDRPRTWNELTTAEQSEALQRGFPRDTGVRYVPYLGYGTEYKGLKLVRWVKIKV